MKRKVLVKALIWNLFKASLFLVYMFRSLFFEFKHDSKNVKLA